LIAPQIAPAQCPTAKGAELAFTYQENESFKARVEGFAR